MKEAFLSRVLRRFDIDRAVGYALVTRGWQFFAAPITLALIAVFFSPALQGYFYTFSSLLALHAFVELGLQHAAISVASHERSRLEISESGELAGDDDARSRLIDLARFLCVWYAAAAVVFSIGAGLFGWWFFSGGVLETAEWAGPWLGLVIIGGLLLVMFPIYPLLEGTDQVAEANRLRSIAAIVGNLVAWISIPLGAGLWAAVLIAGSRLLLDVWMVFRRRRRFFAVFLRRPSGKRIGWREEIWPMQWRLALQGVFGYFALWLLTPVMFAAQGAEVAGRMGMTWTVLTTLQLAAFAWVQTRAPQFGQLVATGKTDELHQRFRRALKFSLAALLFAGGLFLGTLALIRALPGWDNGVWNLIDRIQSRLLSVSDAAILLGGIICWHLPQCVAIKLRAYRAEPLFLVMLIANLATGGLICALGFAHGSTGAALGYLGANALAIPVVLCAAKRFEDHHTADAASTSR